MRSSARSGRARSKCMRHAGHTASPRTCWLSIGRRRAETMSLVWAQTIHVSRLSASRCSVHSAVAKTFSSPTSKPYGLAAQPL